MKVIFVGPLISLNEPLGSMLLIAICKKTKHDTKLVDLRRHDLCNSVEEWDPDVIAYNAMTADMHLFE